MGRKTAKLIGNGEFKYKQGIYVGNYNSYDIIIRYDSVAQLYNMFFSIKELKDLSKLNKQLQKLDKHCVGKYKNNLLTITHACDSSKDLPILVNKVLELVVKFLTKNKIKNVCRKCHKVADTSLIDYDGNLSFYCDKCFRKVEEDNIKFTNNYKKMEENFVVGLLGSIIGSLPGVLIFLVLSYLKINGWLAALIIMLGSAYGYKWFAGVLKEKGLVISLIIGFIFIIFANEFTNAYNLYLEYESIYKINIIDAYKAIPYYVEHSEAFRVSYYQNLAIAILFGVMGSVSNVGLYRRYMNINKIKKVK